MLLNSTSLAAEKKESEMMNTQQKCEREE